MCDANVKSPKIFSRSTPTTVTWCLIPKNLTVLVANRLCSLVAKLPVGFHSCQHLEVLKYTLYSLAWTQREHGTSLTFTIVYASWCVYICTWLPVHNAALQSASMLHLLWNPPNWICSIGYQSYEILKELRGRTCLNGDSCDDSNLDASVLT